MNYLDFYLTEIWSKDGVFRLIILFHELWKPNDQLSKMLILLKAKCQNDFFFNLKKDI